jgi:hypothetical protein
LIAPGSSIFPILPFGSVGITIMFLFAIGDCRNAIHLWEPTTGGKWIVDKKPFQGHSASVEDLQVFLGSCQLAAIELTLCRNK